jgi:gluconolactonase
MKTLCWTVRSLAFLSLLSWLVAGSLSAQEKTEEGKPKRKAVGRIERLDKALDDLLEEDTKIEVLADGFDWTEGPAWSKEGAYLVFSDIPLNRIYQWKEGGSPFTFPIVPKAVTKRVNTTEIAEQFDLVAEQGRDYRTYMLYSGYTGATKFAGGEPGTNGLAFDSKGRLVMCCHGDRQVVRVESTSQERTVLAATYDGKRLNSPNDLVYHSSGDLYFTDPPYGLPKQMEDPGCELGFCGVYRLYAGGELELLTSEMTRPNGIALSPDEKTLYVAQSDPKAAMWMAFPLDEEGKAGEGKVFYDATKWVGKRPGLPDGLKVDQKGNLWATGPGGVLIFSPEGKLLGRIDTGERTANCAFGEDGSTLFICADMYLLRVKTLAKGIGF